MIYANNPFAGCGYFSVPCDAADRHLKIASPLQLKVLLWACRQAGGSFDPAAVAGALRCDESEAADALSYWAEAGILLAKDRPQTAPKEEKPIPKKAVRAAAVKPDRAEVTRRGLECPELGFLLQEAQQKFGRALKQSEASTIVWLYDDQGINLPLMLLLFENAAAAGTMHIGAIERTAMEWVDAGVTDVAAAEAYIVAQKAKRDAWATVERAFGIPHRKPSDREAALACTWVEEWAMPFDLLREAYNVCIDNTAKLSMAYIGKVLSRWKAAGYTTVEETRRQSETKSSPNATYDLTKATDELYSTDD